MTASLVSPSRRGIIGGLASLVCSPALVRADSLMKIRGTVTVIPARFDVSDLPEYLVFYTTHRGSATPKEVCRIRL